MESFLDFYVSFHFPSREVLVVKECPVKGDQVEVIYDLPVDCGKVMNFSPVVLFFRFLCLPAHGLQLPGAPVRAWRRAIPCWALQGWDLLHPGAHSQAEILV